MRQAQLELAEQSIKSLSRMWIQGVLRIPTRFVEAHGIVRQGRHWRMRCVVPIYSLFGRVEQVRRPGERCLVMAVREMRTHNIGGQCR